MKNTAAYIIVLLLGCSLQKQNTAHMQKASFDKQGHRGCRGLMPENTLPAMKKAIDLGVTTLELDVVISRDKKPVVSHEVYFHQHITTTPAGLHLTKEEAEKHLLYGMDYDSIRLYDVGLKPHPGFPRQEKIAVSKPLLADLIAGCETYAAEKGRVVAYNIEIKSAPENDGRKHPGIEEFADLVMTVIKEKGISSRTTIQSFDIRALQVVHHKYPGIATALLVEDTDKRPPEQQLAALGFVPSIYSPHYSLVDSALIGFC
ncbi:MAG TPA: glycerophosphodiester phosphodiesterase family protein, partial [Flavisolibacter sp.]|nr:glycerophosphodiester phosphodiesterase family protein [Flavisolibacter sp.]